MLYTDFLVTGFLHMADTRLILQQNVILGRAVRNEGYGGGADCKVVDITPPFQFALGLCSLQSQAQQHHCHHPGPGTPKPQICHFTSSAVVEEMVMFANGKNKKAAA